MPAWYEQYIPQAPCYWRLNDDGADFGCRSCNERFPHYKMYFTLTPDGTASMTCTDCIDQDWLAKAKKMGAL
jgi:hypothetical protein